MSAELDAAAIEGFVRTFLHHTFDTPADIPDFHRVMWADCMSAERFCAWAAPRDHAKSTAITLTCPLAEALLGAADFFVLVSDTEGQAKDFLASIKNQLLTNELLIETFGIILPLEKDSETDIIVRTRDSYFRMIAKGAEQKVRGLKWLNKRPNRIYVDDIENDEIVQNENRRKKFRSWFLKALMPCLAKTGKLRVVGTILHSDSLLERLLLSPHWRSRRYEAHNDDFSIILWPSRWTRAEFEAIMAKYLDEGDPEGYFQEYRNKALDDSKSLFQRHHFGILTPAARKRRMTYYLTGDLAVSEEQNRDYTFLIVCGVDDDGFLNIVHAEYGRWESDIVADRLFLLFKQFRPALMGFEKGQIQKTLMPFLRKEMIERQTFLPIWTVASSRDKVARTTSIRAMMRSLRVFFDQVAPESVPPWFPVLFWQMCRFPRDTHDDGVDAMSLLGTMLDYVRSLEAPDADADDPDDPRNYPSAAVSGRNRTTGY